MVNFPFVLTIVNTANPFSMQCLVNDHPLNIAFKINDLVLALCLPKRHYLVAVFIKCKVVGIEFAIQFYNRLTFWDRVSWGPGLKSEIVRN